MTVSSRFSFFQQTNWTTSVLSARPRPLTSTVDAPIYLRYFSSDQLLVTRCVSVNNAIHHQRALLRAKITSSHKSDNDPISTPRYEVVQPQLLAAAVKRLLFRSWFAVQLSSRRPLPFARLHLCYYCTSAASHCGCLAVMALFLASKPDRGSYVAKLMWSTAVTKLHMEPTRPTRIIISILLLHDFPGSLSREPWSAGRSPKPGRHTLCRTAGRRTD